MSGVSGQRGCHLLRSPSGASIILESALSSPGSPGISSPGWLRTRSSALGTRKKQGFGSTMQERSRPYASLGVEGIAILKPGMWVAALSKEWEW